MATPSKKVSVSSGREDGRSPVPGPSSGAGGEDSVGWINLDSGQEIKQKVEIKIMSMWQNMKYGWTSKLKTTFNKEQPIWLLGKYYHKRECQSSSSSPNHQDQPTTATLFNEQSFELGQEVGEIAVEEEEADKTTPAEDDGVEGFKRDFITRIWMTYRREFPTMNGTNLTTDCGWGCMLRSGQMLFAQAMLQHFLGRSWRYYEDYPHLETVWHRKIISWFGDNPSHSSPFSIHQLVTMGEQMGRKAGDWYGPNAVAMMLKKAHMQASQEIADLDTFSIYVAQNCTIFIQDVLDQCLISDQQQQTLPWQPTELLSGEKRVWRSLILLVPLRLGGLKFNPIYGESLKALLSLDNCLGIIGGRPKHSLYFVGFQEDKLIFLDPHFCQEMVDVHQENFSVQSFHCKSPRKMKISKLDPCCVVGFYCETRMDFENFITQVEPYLIPVGNSHQLSSHQSMTSSLNLSNYPMFVFSQGRAVDQEEQFFQHFYGDKAKNYQEADEGLTVHANSTDDEEFEEFVIV